ncbi:MAG: RNA polymerase sporulation sigma factor, SigF/SigG family [Roseburia sp.]|jgi:RNA polymerase sporulation-specific sigma factor|nr:RNA polymerase sporulation sigma factor, SigF/SigG family [Roseburia sp.]
MECFAELMGQAHEGDKEARDRLVSDNLGLVWAVARRFDNRGHDREEIFQIGCIGLMKAIDKFDLSLHLAFSTYAVPMITGEIRRFLRDDGMVKVSRTLKENGYKISKAKEQLTKELGREPELTEISEATGFSAEEIVLATEANREVESIYQPVYEKDGDELLLIDQIGGGACSGEDEPQKEAVLNRMVVRQLLDLLGEQERRLILLRYFENKTQSQVAGELGMSQVQVSRLEKKILLRLREKMV